MIVNLLVVAIGSAVGGSLRYLISLAAIGGTSGGTILGLPPGTLLVNVTGGLAIGAVVNLFPSASSHWRLLLSVGICGGFTTFSAFSLETLQLLHDRSIAMAFWNVFANVTLSLLACLAGWALTK